MGAEGAAYKQLTKSPNYLGGVIKDLRQEENAKQAAAKLADERALVRKEKDSMSAWENLSNEPEEGFTNVATGFQSVDNITADYVMNTSQQYGKIKREGQEAWDRGDKKGYYDAQQSLQTLNTNYNLLNTSSEVIYEGLEEFNTLMEEGKVSPVDEEYVAERQAYLNNNFRVVNGEDNVAWIEIELENSKGEKKYTRKTLQELIEDKPPYLIFELNGDEGWINQFASKQGLTTKKDPKGLYSINTEKWTDRNQTALDASITSIQMDARKMSSVLYQANGLKKKKDFTNTDYDTVKKHLTDRVMGQITSKEEKVLSSAAVSFHNKTVTKPDEIYDSKLVKDSKSGNSSIETIKNAYPDNPEIYEGSTEYTMKNKKGTPLKGVIANDAGLELVTLIKGGNGKYYGKVRASSNETVKEETFQGDDGELALKSTTTKGKISKADVIELTNTDLALIANANGLDDVSKLSAYLEERGGGKNKIKVTW